MNILKYVIPFFGLFFWRLNMATEPVPPPAPGPAPVPPVPPLPPEPPVPPPAPVSIALDDKGNFSKDWVRGLPSEFHENKTLSNFTTIEGLARTVVNQQRMIGKNTIVHPDQNSDEATWEAYYRAGGRPETADKYAYEGADKLEAGTDAHTYYKSFTDASHKLGLNQKQFEGIMAWNGETADNAEAARKAASAAEAQTVETELRKEYGADGYIKNMDIANRVVRTFGMAESIEELGLINNAAMVRALVKIGGNFSEDKLLGGTDSQTIQDIDTRINELMSGEAYKTSSHANHKAVTAEVYALRQRKHGE